MFAQRRQRLGQCIGGVCIVDHGRGLVVARGFHYFHAPGRRDAKRQSAHRVAERRPQGQETGEHHQGILGVEPAQQLCADGRLAEAAVELHRQAVRVQSHAVGMQAALSQPSRFAGPDPDRRERNPSRVILRKLAPKGIADVDDDVLQVGASNSRALAAP